MAIVHCYTQINGYILPSWESGHLVSEQATVQRHVNADTGCVA